MQQDRIRENNRSTEMGRQLEHDLKQSNAWTLLGVAWGSWSMLGVVSYEKCTGMAHKTVQGLNRYVCYRGKRRGIQHLGVVGVCMAHGALLMACVGVRGGGGGGGAKRACRSHPGFAPDASSFPALRLGLLVLPAQALQGTHHSEPSVHVLNMVHSIPLCLCPGTHATQGGCSHPAPCHSGSLSSWLSR